MGRNLTRWLIPLPAILFAVFPQTVYAEPVAGLNAVGYIVTEIPPTQSDTIYETCGTELENNINRNFNGEPFGTCPVDYFMIHYTGFITIPEHNTIEFWLASDDGGQINIGGNEWGSWNDRHCTWMASGQLNISAGNQALNLWMYENGGSTCLMLAWNINNAGWVIVPDSAFTTNGAPTTTTTTSPTTTTTTTSSTTTTTIAETTTTSSTTTVQETTTSWVPSTTSTTSTTTSTTTVVQTTVPATTTTTFLPVPTATTSTTEVIVSTTTTQPEKVKEELKESQETISPTTEILPDPTTSTISEPESETTEPETFTTYPDQTSPEDISDETSAPKVEELPEEDTPDTTGVEEPSSSTTTIPDVEPIGDTPEELKAFVEELDIQEDEPITNEKVEQILEVLADVTPAQVVAVIEQLLTKDITPDQAAEIASTPEVLVAITEEQAEELFEELDVTELDNTQLEAFTEVIQEAPTKIKKTFEKTIDVFGSQFENYIPTGSNVPVKTRRTLVAAGALITAMSSTRIKKQ